MIVRPATLDDVPAIIEMGEEIRRESVVPFPAINGEMVEMIARELFPRRDLFCALIAEEDGVPAGMMTGMASHYLFSPYPVAQHDTFFVRPEHRGGRAARMLIDQFVEWATEIDAVRVILGVHTGIAPEKTGRLYRLLGFTEMGGLYFKEIA